MIQDSAEEHFLAGGKKWWKAFLYSADFLGLRQFSEQEAKVSKWVKILEEKAGNSPCKTQRLWGSPLQISASYMQMGYYLPGEEVEGIVGPAPPSFPTSQDKINMCHNETLVLFIDIKLMDCKLRS